MYVQACTNHNIKTARRPAFKSRKKDEDYFAYMSRHSDDILQGSVMIGGISGAVAARKNVNEDAAYTILRHIGISTLALFGLTSLSFSLPETIKK